MTPKPIPLTRADTRLHGLDAVRGFALLLGVALHASMSYLPGAQYFWIVADDPSLALSGLFFWVHLFRMTTFFLIAGFFGRMQLARLGPAQFLRDRFRRVVLPLLMAWPRVFTGIVLVIIWLALIKFGGSLPKESPPGPKFTPDDFPLTHLWFLYFLSGCYLAVLGLRALFAALDQGGRLSRLSDRLMQLAVKPGAALVLALPTAIALISQPGWRMWFGIPTPDHSLYPNLAAVVAYGGAFAFGWLLQRQQCLLASLQQHWLWQLGLALVASTGCLMIVGITPQLGPAPGAPTTLLYAYGYAVAGISWTFALLGAALHFLSGYSPARRYIADASYWVYLVHLPIVMALQVAGSLLRLPWWLEYPLALLLGATLMFGSYALLVRKSWIGALLSGRAKPDHPAKAAVNLQASSLSSELR